MIVNIIILFIDYYCFIYLIIFLYNALFTVLSVLFYMVLESAFTDHSLYYPFGSQARYPNPY